MTYRVRELPNGEIPEGKYVRFDDEHWTGDSLLEWHQILIPIGLPGSAREVFEEVFGFEPKVYSCDATEWDYSEGVMRGPAQSYYSSGVAIIEKEALDDGE